MIIETLRHLTNGSRWRGAMFLVAMLLAATAMSVAVAGPQDADQDKHGGESAFIGVVTGTIPADLGPPVPGTGGCVFEFTVTNAGNATHLGQFTGSATFRPNLCNGSYTGSFNWIAANGDRITGPFMGQNFPTATPGVVNNVETAIITGGTGRFKHASGLFNLYGQIDFVNRVFNIPFMGTLER